MRPILIFLSALCLLPLVAAAQQPEASPMLGFSAASAKSELATEKRFSAIPDPAKMRAHMKLLSAYPHNTGSPYDKHNAEWILAQYKKWGWDAHIEVFYPLFPTPKVRVLTMGSFHARLQEPPLPGDPTSHQTAEQLPTYNAYSPDGDVTAPLVYVNYGTVQDYETLARYGISVKGKIVIVRYGEGWRGVKVKLATEHGAIGCIIYSDPADDGYAVGPTLPNGPMRPPEGVQRGSILEAPLYPGDPLTPGWAATKDARRLKRSEAPSLPKIPTQPISYGDAQPLLAALQGPVAPKSWRGALPITYRIGPSKEPVHLKLVFNWKLTPVYDVIAVMRGSEDPNIWVLRGNHHDAWVNGAEDPTSGQVALLAEARAIGELAKTGWRPKRTIMYMSWDGEEPMLLGSTEWGEDHAAELREHAAVYINSDSNDRGFLSVSGSQSLETLLNQVVQTIKDPETGASVWERLRAKRLLDGTPGERQEALEGRNLRIGALGTGSDFTVFLDHLGIPALDASYRGEYPKADGVYHSTYDDFYWYTHYCDTTFVYERAEAQTLGKMVLRMANADILPYNFADLAGSLHRYDRQVKALLKEEAKEAKLQDAAMAMHAYALTNNPRQPTPVAPPKLNAPLALDFAPLDNAIAALDKSSAHFNQARSKVLEEGVSDEKLNAINDQLALAARKLQNPHGLPGRSWYQNLIYAPGWYTGYGAKTLPGVREAIEQHKYSLAAAQITILAQAIQNEAAYLGHLADELDRISGSGSTQTGT